MDEEDLGQWSPPRWRVVLAFLIVPGAISFALAAIEPAYVGLESYFERVWRTAVTFALFGAYPSALLFGLPAYAALRRLLAPTWINCALVGAIVAAFPWFLIVILGPAADEASMGGQATVIGGRYTLFGWQENLKFVSWIGLFGAAAGVLFWIIATAGSRPAKKA